MEMLFKIPNLFVASEFDTASTPVSRQPNEAKRSDALKNGAELRIVKESKMCFVTLPQVVEERSTGGVASRRLKIKALEIFEH